MPPQALAAVATLLSFVPHGNRIELRLDHGSAELVWVSPSTFHFRRSLEGPLAAPQGAPKDDPGASFDLHIEEDPGALRIRSRNLEVTLRKRGLLVSVERLGETVMADLSEPSAAPGGGVIWERQAPAGVRFYGLGPNTDAGFNLRGRAVRAENAFLLSTAGYGEYHPGAGPFQFDFTPADRYRVQAPAVDYYFFFGTTPKQIFEQANPVRGPSTVWKVAPAGPGTWATLQATVLRLVHAALSGMNEPALSLMPWAAAAPELRERVRQVASLVLEVAPAPIGLSEFRGKLTSFLAAYAIELRDRGLPLWHPLPFEFPADAECARHADEFLLGDEMLVAPICQPGNRRQVYLPPGEWTSLETNAVTTGRQTISVDTAALPVFARNGSIVPLDANGEVELHYFPKLAAEFFLLDNDALDWTQVHAAPAADVMRLEIEAKSQRTYQWVVHHVERPGTVSFEEHRYQEAPSLARLAAGAWFWDAARRNLHIRLRAEKGQDAIVDVAW
ncbi:MAG TPA: hypothetical protein VME43_32870 [Bryobacteraceae bacterium]|nr:hypothetical protein [Bryobacteraceae bacterium]